MASRRIRPVRVCWLLLLLGALLAGGGRQARAAPPVGDPPVGRMARWRQRLFIVMARNAQSATAFFGLPPNRVVELGAQIQF